MSRYTYRIFVGKDGLRSAARDWNALWGRSGARQPTVRAGGILAWLDAFGRGRPLNAVAVEEDGHLVAALPVVADARWPSLAPARLPVNCWASAGDLLLDEKADRPAAASCLLDGLAAAGIRLLALEEIAIDAPWWQVFADQIQQRQGKFYCRRRRRVGVVDILHDWERYQQSWSSNHRSAVRRSYKKLCQAGEVRTERFSSVDDPLEELLLTAFEIENRSWKGEAGTSVLKTPGMFPYMLAEAREAARDGHLDLWFLYLDDKPLAFEYCHIAKGVCFSHKIGYDAEYARFGPGRLLRYLQLQAYHSDPSCRQFDMLGSVCRAKAKWATSTYVAGDCLAAIDRGPAGLSVSAYERCRGWVDRWQEKDADEEPTPGAAALFDSPTLEDVGV